MARRLAVFDFNETITTVHSDLEVSKLLKPDQIPEYNKMLYKTRPEYMREIFGLCQKYDIGESIIKKAVVNVLPTDGIKDLIIALVNNYNCDVVVISDGNTLFLNEWFAAHGLDMYIFKIFANPAKFQKSGFLQLNDFHRQYKCRLCPTNMCKGKVLEKFLDTQKKCGIVYKQIIFLGDDVNNFCVMIKLKETDLACPKEGSACADLVKQALEKTSDHNMQAKVFTWKTGYDVLNELCLSNTKL